MWVFSRSPIKPIHASAPLKRCKNTYLLYLVKSLCRGTLAIELTLFLDFYIICRSTAFEPISTTKPQLRGYNNQFTYFGSKYSDQQWVSLLQALTEGRDCTSPLPKDRFDIAALYHPDLKKAGKLYCERGGFVNQDVFMFDRQFFKMPPGDFP